MSSTPARHVGLVGHDADAAAADAAEADHDVLREERLRARRSRRRRRSASIALDDIVGFVGRIGDQRIELRTQPLRIVGGRDERRVVEIVLRDEREQAPGLLVHLVFVGGDEVVDAGLRRVRHRAAQLFEGNVLTGDGLDDLGAGDEHLRDAFDHDREVGDRRRVHRAAGARAGDQADLRNHPRGLNVAPKNLGVTAQADDAFLDPRAARIVDADHRRTGADRQVHDLADFLGEDFAQRAAQHREVLREEEDVAAVDRRACR